MPRPRQRATLECGLKLDLYQMARRGIVRPGGISSPTIMQWMYGGEVSATASVWANLKHEEGSFRIQASWTDQWILLQSLPRHFGEVQWFFICPVTNRRTANLWMPPGADRFASRYAWPRSVAYASQFGTPSDRAWRGKEKIKHRLIADLDPDDWDLPPKPKWMRWGTYNRYEAKFDHYEDMLDWHCFRAARRLLKAFGGRF